jgi:2-phosphosulfolactate phosphatase
MQHSQHQALVRMEWGQPGAAAICAADGVAVIVDVLSFTTTLTVALDGGIEVYPYQWGDESACEFARRHKAALAAGRLESRTAPDLGPVISLSPASIRSAAGLTRIVLPSPNGSALARQLAGTGATIVGAALRNRSAVARWIAGLLTSDTAGAAGGSPTAIAVIAAGERWPDGSLRPAVEDLWGAGAVISALSDLGVGDQSPEAWTAEAAFRGVEASLAAELADCGSGQELIQSGFADDVAIAAEIDASDRVPLLRGERFVNAESR